MYRSRRGRGRIRIRSEGSGPLYIGTSATEREREGKRTSHLLDLPINSRGHSCSPPLNYAFDRKMPLTYSRTVEEVDRRSQLVAAPAS